MVDDKVELDAHKVVLTADDSCLKRTSTKNSDVNVKDANVNQVKTMK